MTLERDIERYLVKRARVARGEVRKVQWIARRNAPDRFLMLPHKPGVWIEVKNPETIRTFPANAHERAQQREHIRMRQLGQIVKVVGTVAQVDELFA